MGGSECAVQVQGGHSSIISMQLCQLRSMSVKNGGEGVPWWSKLCLVAVVFGLLGDGGCWGPPVLLFTHRGCPSKGDPSWYWVWHVRVLGRGGVHAVAVVLGFTAPHCLGPGGRAALMDRCLGPREDGVPQALRKAGAVEAQAPGSRPAARPWVEDEA